VSGYPVQMAVRVDFSDGSQHEYEVRGPDATEVPGVLWPAAVVSAAHAKQITREQACTEALAQASARLRDLRDWAVHQRDMDPQAEPGDLRNTGYLAAIADVLRILDEP
jgi:hypothetical protein